MTKSEKVTAGLEICIKMCEGVIQTSKAKMEELLVEIAQAENSKHAYQKMLAEENECPTT